MERYCPSCGRVFESGRNKCHKCDVVTLATEKTKEAQKSTACPDCGGTGQLHYDGQIGSEPTPAAYIAALVDCTREWVRVLKPEGSLFVNLGDKYSSGAGPQTGEKSAALRSTKHGHGGGSKWAMVDRQPAAAGFAPKCLLGLPWRYAIACTDQLGLILRAEIIWQKPNGLPESVTDRVRRAHEQLFHFTRSPRYYAAVDEIREASTTAAHHARYAGRYLKLAEGVDRSDWQGHSECNPLGKLPGSVWSIPSQPLVVPPHLGVDHFAAFPMELPRRVIQGWSPPGVCTACGQGRVPTSATLIAPGAATGLNSPSPKASGSRLGGTRDLPSRLPEPRHRSCFCACTPYTDHPGTCATSNRRGYDPSPNGNHAQGVYSNKAGEYERVGPWREYHFDRWTPPPTTPALVVDPFGGTGTTALVASVLGRNAITVDRSADYSRLAAWRTRDPGERARAMQVPKPPPIPHGQESLFDMEAM